MHAFSEGNVKQFDMVLLFSFGTLDMFALLLSLFFPFFLFPHELVQERESKVLPEKEVQCVWSDLGDFASVIALAKS